MYDTVPLRLLLRSGMNMEDYYYDYGYYSYASTTSVIFVKATENLKFKSWHLLSAYKTMCKHCSSWSSSSYACLHCDFESVCYPSPRFKNSDAKWQRVEAREKFQLSSMSSLSQSLKWNKLGGYKGAIKYHYSTEFPEKKQVML